MTKQYVLSCINGFPPSQAVIDYGKWLAKLMNKNLKLFHAIDQQFHENQGDLSGSIGLGAREDMLAEIVEIEHEQNRLIQKRAQLILDSGKLHAEENFEHEVKTCLRRGRVLDNILDFKDELSIAVIGKYGKRHQGMSASETPVGHKVEKLVKKLNLPIMIVTEDFVAPKSILLAYDGSEGANKVADFLAQNLSTISTDIEIVFFGKENELNRQMLAGVKEKFSDKNKVTLTIIEAAADVELPKYFASSDNDILAMGAFGHGMIHDLLLGSLTSQMIQDSKKPILLIK